MGIQNDKIYSILIAASEETMANEMNVESRMELDSHMNMPVVGKHAYIIAETGKKVNVSPFTPDYQPLMVPLVDATVRYNNPYGRKSYILVLWNALYVPSMDNNLIPPFMLREMGVTVNDVPQQEIKKRENWSFSTFLNSLIIQVKCHVIICIG